MHAYTCQLESGTVRQTNRLPSKLNSPWKKPQRINLIEYVMLIHRRAIKKMGLLPTASLSISLFLPLALLFSSYRFLAKPRWMLNCHRSNPAWLWETVQFQIHSSLQQIMIWSGLECSMKPVHNLLHVVSVQVTHMCGQTYSKGCSTM